MPFSPSHRAAPYPPTLTVPSRGAPSSRSPVTALHPSTKAFYVSVLNILLLVNLAAGLISWFTQFLLSCEHARLHILVALASQAFLANVLGLLLAHTILYPLADTTRLHGFRALITRLQLVLVTLVTALSFFLLAFAATAGYDHSVPTTVPFIGVGLCALLVLGLVFTAASTAILNRLSALKQDREDGAASISTPALTAVQAPPMPLFQFVPIAIITAVQMVAIIALLAAGLVQAVHSPTHVQCEGMSGATEWGKGVVPVSIVGVGGSEASKIETALHEMGMGGMVDLMTTVTGSVSMTTLTSSSIVFDGDGDGIQTVVVSLTSTVYANDATPTSKSRHN